MRDAAFDFQIRSLDEIETTKTTWLWENWIPFKAITILEGDPGLGKTTLLCDLAARVSNGMPMPCSELKYLGVDPDTHEDVMEHPTTFGSVLFLSAEDDPDSTLGPRLYDAGASGRRVHFVEMALVDGLKFPDGLLVPVDIPKLTEKFRDAFPPVKLVIIDPIMAYLGGIDTNKDNEVRSALGSLRTMAQELNCAVLICRHYNKASKGKGGITAGGGSIAFTGAARSVIGTQRIKGSEWVKFWMTKSNLGPTGQQLQFKVDRGCDRDEMLRRGESFDEDMIYQSKIVWEKARAIDEAEEPATPEEDSKLAIAMAFLEDAFRRDEQLTTSILYKDAEDIGINVSTLKLAKKRLGIESKNVRGEWKWMKQARVGLEE